MKKTVTILAFLIVNFFSFSLKAQEIISPENVSTTQLKEIFQNAYIDILESSDTYVKIKDKRNVFIDIYPNKKYVTMSISYTLKANSAPDAIIKLVNKLNKEVVMLKVWHSIKNNSLVFSYYLWIDGGAQAKTLISAVKYFQMGLDLCLDKDEEKLIL